MPIDEEKELIRAELEELKKQMNQLTVEAEELATYRKKEALKAADIDEYEAHFLEKLEGIHDREIMREIIKDEAQRLRLEKRKEGADPISKGNGISRPPRKKSGEDIGRETARRILSERKQ